MGMKLDGRENREKIKAIRVDAREKGGERKKKKWDRGKGDLGEQFHFTLHINTIRNVTSVFYWSHVKHLPIHTDKS